MSETNLIAAIVALCSDRSLSVERDVKVGPYLAPLVIQGNDTAGTGRDVRIAIEPRHWSRSVAARMAKWAELQRDRLRQLTEVDFVAIVIDGHEDAPGGLTSLGELATFLDGFGPAHAETPSPITWLGAARGSPVPTEAYEQELAGVLASWTGGGLLFCAMPFAGSFDPVFFDLIVPAAGEAGLTVLRTDQEETLRAIDLRIRDGIRRSDLVVADITGHNPNVFYELGVAHALNKQTLLLRQDALPPPFDIHYHELFDYSPADLAAARGRLAKRLREAAASLWDR